ncbi:MAG: hypothetical protein ACYC2I_05440 [Elusimicrobiales bacterium]
MSDTDDLKDLLDRLKGEVHPVPQEEPRFRTTPPEERRVPSRGSSAPPRRNRSASPRAKAAGPT